MCACRMPHTMSQSDQIIYVNTETVLKPNESIHSMMKRREKKNEKCLFIHLKQHYLCLSDLKFAFE